DVLVACARATSTPLQGPAGAIAGAVRRALGSLSVVIDARILAGPLNGTRVHVLELLAALAETRAVRLTAIVPRPLDDRTRALLERVEGIELRSLGDGSPIPRTDVAHLPHQVGSAADLTVLGRLGERVIITQQDLIGYHSPSHFPSDGDWQRYRELTRRALAAADGVAFFSAHARAEALADGLVAADRAHVVPIGVDHTLVATVSAQPPPGAQARLGRAEAILCLGTDFGHKNRPFALRVVAQLRALGWEGRLVFAGPHVEYGSTRVEEEATLARDPGLAEAVIDLGEVSDAGREWLYERASLVLCPTVREGFGLVPHEAAAHGVPCLWAPGTALAELLPREVAAIVPWDPEATAAAALTLLRERAAGAANVEAVRSAGDRLRWADTGRVLADVYAAVCERPPSPAATLEREAGVMRADVSEDGIALVGPGGLLPPDLERPLLALLARERIARPLSAALKAGYRASQRRSSVRQR
ncbi:MAG: glycosyltransferase, partial [Solirubrobacteraceae bacterium]